METRMAIVLLLLRRWRQICRSSSTKVAGVWAVAAPQACRLVFAGAGVLYCAVGGLAYLLETRCRRCMCKVAVLCHHVFAVFGAGVSGVYCRFRR